MKEIIIVIILTLAFILLADYKFNQLDSINLTNGVNHEKDNN